MSEAQKIDEQKQTRVESGYQEQTNNFITHTKTTNIKTVKMNKNQEEFEALDCSPSEETPDQLSNICNHVLSVVDLNNLTYASSETVIEDDSGVDTTTSNFAANCSNSENHPGDDGSFRTSVTRRDSHKGLPYQSLTESVINVMEQSALEMVKIWEPNIFHGTPDEDVIDWLERFEDIAEANKWQSNRLIYAKLYLEGTARQCVKVMKPVTWEEFKFQFLKAFKRKDYGIKLRQKLESRQQQMDEPLERYFYDVLDMYRKLEEETEQEVPEIMKIKHIAIGLTPPLLSSLWPQIPDVINTTSQLLEAARKYAHAIDIIKDRDSRNVYADMPGIVSREEVNTAKLLNLIKELKKEVMECKYHHKTSAQNTPRNMPKYGPRRNYRINP